MTYRNGLYEVSLNSLDVILRLDGHHSYPMSYWTLASSQCGIGEE